MALIESPASPLVPRLQGLHLFGFDGAPCAQRVNFALAEKGLERARKVKWADDHPAALVAPPGTYVYREVSLVRHDNLTEGYAAIQPNMVVPALVHDGRLYIESMDIIAYLDEAFPEQPLRPREPAAAALCDELVQLGKDLHVSVRHVTFHWSLGGLARTDTETEARVARLERGDSPEGLAEFYRRFNGNAIELATFHQHLHELEDGYAQQETRLADGRPFLTGPDFSIADIIWAIKVLRLTECAYPFARNFPHLAAWYRRVAARPGFRQGVLGRYKFVHHVFRVKGMLMNLFGRGVVNASRVAA
ncbi:MAG: glutathione S-transferase family protein [Gammaproteobacteria bacterium]|nr:glutathione S-transferase family protein [Gammaproteobacteria bacterium]